jgi:hypothetical protein
MEVRCYFIYEIYYYEKFHKLIGFNTKVMLMCVYMDEWKC